MLTALQYRILKTISPGEPGCCSGAFYQGKSKLRLLLGGELLARVAGCTVLDFGCGEGTEALELARSGARRVIGLDIRPEVLEIARRNAAQAGLAEICTFATTTSEPVDLIISLDSFEHFHDPPVILRTMAALLAAGGEVLASFGPTWFHPLGGHLFSVFPWAHLVFSEKALIRWRADFKNDGATCFREVAGGLNRMTIRRFEKLVAASPFELAHLETVPIRKLRPVHGSWNREFTSALVRCRLAKRVCHDGKGGCR